MILSELKSYLRDHGQASLADMVLHFEAEPDVLRAMLQVWMHKGKVECYSVSPDCGGNCNRCPPEATEIYRWRVEGGE